MVAEYPNFDVDKTKCIIVYTLVRGLGTLLIPNAQISLFQYWWILVRYIGKPPTPLASPEPSNAISPGASRRGTISLEPSAAPTPKNVSRAVSRRNSFNEEKKKLAQQRQVSSGDVQSHTLLQEQPVNRVLPESQQSILNPSSESSLVNSNSLMQK